MTTLLLFLFGLCVGSFCNVLIYRLPKEEDFVRTPSHCMFCGHPLRWFELIPLVSWLIQKGKCRACGHALSPQYPIVEGLNGLFWALTGLLFPGDWITIGLYCGFSSLLMVLAVIDWRTFEIPNGVNLSIFVLGLVRLCTDFDRAGLYLIGMCSVSLVFLALWAATRGNGLGMGDVKLMAASGLLLGWPNMILATLIGSLTGSVIHLWRMRGGAGHKLAFGPYLAFGLWVSALFGGRIISVYLGLFGL